MVSFQRLIGVGSLVVALLATGCSDMSGGADPQVRPTSVLSGAQMLSKTGFESIKGKHVGLIVNHTSRVGNDHLIDVLSASEEVNLVALFGPEHGIRGDEDAGAKIEDGIDDATGVPVFSLYGANRRPTPEMLAGVDALVFDIQDVGARFYTFISTMGLSMQSAAEAGIPFIVLDRPNPLGGMEIEGFVLDTTYTSFVGQYPIPVRYGLTMGELALMIKGEKWIPGIENLDLQVVKMSGWSRDMLWPDTKLDWIPTSPNLPTFESALMYPGTCYFEATTASEGRGTDLPFLTVGAPWMNAASVAAPEIDGMRLIPGKVTPIEMPGKSSNPKWKDAEINSISIEITDLRALRPVSAGLELIARMYSAAPSDIQASLFNERWMTLLGGTDQLTERLKEGLSAIDFQELWKEELARFDTLRKPYLLYR